MMYVISYYASLISLSGPHFLPSYTMYGQIWSRWLVIYVILPCGNKLQRLKRV